MINIKATVLFLLVITPMLYCMGQSKSPAVTNLTCEYLSNPLGVDAEKPVLSWNILSDLRNTGQEYYRILVSDKPENIKSNIGNIWDTDMVKSDKSIQVIYNGSKLLSGRKYYWKVQIRDNYNNLSSWSAIAFWQMGLLKNEDWKGARWIAYEEMADSNKIFPFYHGGGPKTLSPGLNTLPIFRKEFRIVKKVKRATLYITGLGHFEASINGKKIGDNFLDQGWTQYNKEALYVSFDLTKSIKEGNNAIGVMLGNGFYYIPRERYRKLTGGFGYPKMICRLALEYTDGSQQNIISDSSWKTTAGPIKFSSIYGGEDYDARLEQKDWNKSGFNDMAWQKPKLVDGVGSLKSQMTYPLKTFDEFKQVKLSQPKPGVWVYDLGQNASGIPKIIVKGKRGSVIKISPAELITDEGLITQGAVGTPVFFNYTLKGDGEEEWKPRFTYYGFRYIQIEGGVPEGKENKNNLPVMLSVSSIHTRNAAPSVGSFECSNKLFNQTYKLIDWAIKSNLASVLTDCPHREKLGWLEEAHLMGPSVRYGYDIASLFNKTVDDMIAAQDSSGLVPDIAPEYVNFPGSFRDSPEWGSNSIILPWYIYQWYGDKRTLEKAYPMMQKYISYLGNKSKNHILSYGLGDWFDIGPKKPGVSQLTPPGVTPTAIYYYDLNILLQICELLNKPDDAKKYKTLAKEVKDEFNKAFFNKETKMYATNSQTTNAMAVYMDLVEPKYKEDVIDNIIKDLKSKDYAITAGDIGFRYLLRVLDDAGRSDVIFKMNSRNDVPGYGYQLAHGATSLTESWQAYTNVSNNHLMLGHLMEWFYSGLAGIKPAQNSIAFKVINIRPEPVGDVTFAKASYLSPYGMIKSEWKKTDNSFELVAEIPANTTCVFYIPSNQNSEILESGKPLSVISNIKMLSFENGKTIVSAGSGSFKFTVTN